MVVTVSSRESNTFGVRISRLQPQFLRLLVVCTCMLIHHCGLRFPILNGLTTTRVPRFFFPYVLVIDILSFPCALGLSAVITFLLPQFPYIAPLLKPPILHTSAHEAPGN